MNTNSEPRRARTMAEMAEKMGSMFAGFESPFKPYEPLPTDVIITPFAKCGTTWLQQIFHTLRTRGATDYDDISRVVPWLEVSARLGIDVNAQQQAEPRGFKSHLSFTDIPKGAKYILSMRDPRDALVSMYRFMEGWFLEPGAVSLEAFARANYVNDPDKGYWGHLRSWWDVRDNPNVLMLSYEAMNADPTLTIKRVAEFCNIRLDDELLAITLKHSSLAYMLENKHQFDDHMFVELSESVAGIPKGSDSAKVREGKVGGHAKVLSPELIATLDDIWASQITARYGFNTYQDMAAAL